MRLTCPNCEAQYEVPDEAIPMDGRDVQCSNCGTNWFAHPAGSNPAARDAEMPASPAHPKPPAMSEDVRAVLQQEAERELAARGASLDTKAQVQHDLDLTAPPAPRPQNYATAAAPAIPAVEQTDPPTQTSPAERRTRLPDIEEINSTLSADAGAVVNKRQKPKPPPDPRRKRRRGFRLGFGLALGVIGCMTAAYVFAPQISATVPNLADEMNNYVFWVNDSRQTMFIWAEQMVAPLTDAMETEPVPEQQPEPGSQGDAAARN